MLSPEESKTSAKHLRISKGSLIKGTRISDSYPHMGSYSLISDPVEVLICSYPESGLLVHLVGTSQATPSNYLQGLTLSTARLVLTSGGLIYYTFIALNNFKILILTSHLVHQPLGFRSVTLNIWGRWSRGQY